MCGYILLKGRFIMTGTTTGLALALFIVGAPGTNQHDGAMIEGEEWVVMDP